MLWALEHRARVKEPTLEEYLKMCEQEQNKKEIKEYEKENCSMGLGEIGKYCMCRCGKTGV